jgi:alkanesulfonate monooxygenase SsuD/methylene tetrahydromethanopterin reductase-like flavin-dependent oxidoreductase (luciferase family)
MIYDLQLSTATSTWTQLCEGALSAEANGFGAVWVWDHLSGDPMGGHTMFDCFTLLGALAAATTTIAIGPMVANVQNRHAATLATAAATTQNISNGRLLLGLGAGGGPNSPFTGEHKSAGISLLPTLSERHSRLVETISVMNDMWAEDRDSRYAGFPRPIINPPTIIGVNSIPLARIAGRIAGGVNVRGQSPAAQSLLHAATESWASAQGHVSADDRGQSAFVKTVWLPLDDSHLAADHPLRIEFCDVDRIIFVAFRPLLPNEIANAARRLEL